MDNTRTDTAIAREINLIRDSILQAERNNRAWKGDLNGRKHFHVNSEKLQTPRIIFREYCDGEGSGECRKGSDFSRFTNPGQIVVDAIAVFRLLLEFVKRFRYCDTQTGETAEEPYGDRAIRELRMQAKGL